ncbi:MAG: hypothetical protein Q4D21_10190 [Phascolarctobacterium sp.]|nr:hypothetical protein [Phascolarctobacterium sp.]
MEKQTENSSQVAAQGMICICFMRKEGIDKRKQILALNVYSCLSLTSELSLTLCDKFVNANLKKFF